MRKLNNATFVFVKNQTEMKLEKLASPTSQL